MAPIDRDSASLGTRNSFDPADRDALPARLRDVPAWRAPKPGRSLTIEGGALDAACVVVIVGTREAHRTMREGAHAIARACAARGIVVASGGARGIDAAAHEGAMACPGGITWAVLGHGAEHVYPREHARLYRRIVEAGGRLIWPFPDAQRPSTFTFLQRNAVLVSLADAVILVQAGEDSGALHSARHARQMGKPLWVVPPVPWVHTPGTRAELERGAHRLDEMSVLFESLAHLIPRHGLRADGAASDFSSGPPGRGALRDDIEQRVIDALAAAPLHPDDVVESTGLGVEAVTRALLTLSLDSVVVIDPDGRYRYCM